MQNEYIVLEGARMGEGVKLLIEVTKVIFRVLSKMSTMCDVVGCLLFLLRI